MPISTGIAWIIRLMMYLVIGSPPVSAPQLLPDPLGIAEMVTDVLDAGARMVAHASRLVQIWARGTRWAGAPSRCAQALIPEGSGLGCYDLAYQSTAFQVGPAWVGFAKKLPSFGPTRSTFLR